MWLSYFFSFLLLFSSLSSPFPCFSHQVGKKLFSWACQLIGIWSFPFLSSSPSPSASPLPLLSLGSVEPFSFIPSFSLLNL